MTQMKNTFEGHTQSLVKAYLNHIELTDPPTYLCHIQCQVRLGK